MFVSDYVMVTKAGWVMVMLPLHQILPLRTT